MTSTFDAKPEERLLADMSDEEILDRIKALGLAMDAENHGHGLGTLKKIMQMAAYEYEQLA